MGFTNVIVFGFPGMGKSWLGSHEVKSYPDYVFEDHESSNYHWIIRDDGTKFCNPDWPNNYIRAAADIMAEINRDGFSAVIMMSTHTEVIQTCMYNFNTRFRDIADEYVLNNVLGIKSCIVAPRATEYGKDEFIKRHKERGNSEEFIKSLDENYYKYLLDVYNNAAFVDSVYFTNGYLSDILYFVISSIPRSDTLFAIKNSNEEYISPSMNNNNPVVTGVYLPCPDYRMNQDMNMITVQSMSAREYLFSITQKKEEE